MRKTAAAAKQTADCTALQSQMTIEHEDPHTTFFCTPHDAGVVKDAKF